jgi:hypothetical protein
VKLVRRTPQQLGLDYEEDFAKRYGGSAQPRSGAGPKYKLDWKLGSLLASLKHTMHESYRLTAAELREALAGAQGPGGRGETPAMVIKMAGFPDDVLVMRVSDLEAMLQGETEVVTFAPSKRAQRLAAVRGGLVVFDPLGGAARGVGRCNCAAGPGTNPGCPVHP